MNIPLIDSSISLIDNLLDRFWPDKEEAEREKAKVAMTSLLAQIEVNKEEAKHSSVFVSGWRPAVGWACVTGLFYTYLFQPILSWLGQLICKANGLEWTALPTIPMSDLLILLGGMLGLGGLRTFEKLKGVARK